MNETEELIDLKTRVKKEDPITWLFLGDSIQHGAFHTFGMRDYVELFDERVRYQIWRINDVVINTSYSGYTVPRVAEELELRCLRFNPDIVGIALGVNDSVEGADGVDAFEQKYSEMIQRIRRETHAHVFLMTQNMIDTEHDPTRISYPLYVEAARRVAAKEKTPLCDIYNVWQQYNSDPSCNRFYLMDDELHPNGFGHRLIANSLLKWIGYGPLERMDPIIGFDPQV